MDLQVDWSSFGNWSNKQQQEEEHQDRRVNEIGFFVDSYLDTRLSEVVGTLTRFFMDKIFVFDSCC